MIELSVKIKADGRTVRHAGIAGTEADKDALIELLEEVMPNPQHALAILRGEVKTGDKANPKG